MCINFQKLCAIISGSLNLTVLRMFSFSVYIHEQDLAYLDALVGKRLSILTKLERAMAIFKMSKKRTTIRVGDMLEEVDAIKYYTRQLEDLNIAVQKEQQTAENLAKYLDKMAGATSLNVIESFLEVTEIGAVSKMLKRKGSKLDPVKSFVNIDDFKDGEGQGWGEGSKGRKKRKELSYIDWANGILFAPTFNEGWRIFREGRHPEVRHNDIPIFISSGITPTILLK